MKLKNVKNNPRKVRACAMQTSS